MKPSLGIIAACLLLVAGPAVAQTSSPAESDRAALAAIVMRSVTEVQLCGLALEKSQNRDVRSFCRSSADDHARTAIAGLQLAQKLGAADVKFAPEAGTPALLALLAQDTGRDFDRAFLLAQIENHEDFQDAIKYAAEEAGDASVRSYARSVLPRVEKYLRLAESALDALAHDQP